MNFIDIILASVLIFGLIQGLWKGFFSELASFISLLVGIFVAVKFSGFTADFIREHFSNESEHLEIIAFAITFILVIIGVVLLGKIFTRMAYFSGLGWINRLLGAVFGLLKMIFILSVALHFFQKINRNGLLVSEEKIDSSLLYNPIITISETVFPTLSEWFDKATEKINISEKEESLST